jgi:uncharacterized RDD family membrane protein YckC
MLPDKGNRLQMENYEEQVRKYSKEELIDVLSNIDREKYPDRYRIARRRYDEIKDDPAFTRADPSGKYRTGSKRFWAMSLDGFFVSLIAGLLFLSFGSLFGADESEDIKFYISPVYTVWLTAVFGKTLGKHLLKLKVVSYPDESNIGIRAAVLREIFPIALIILSIPISVASAVLGDRFPASLKLASGIILALGSFGWLILEIATMMRDPQRRAFHDKIAGTVVIIEER